VSEIDGVRSQFDLQRLQVGRRIVLAAAGGLDLGSAPALPAAIEAALDSGARDLWIDLSDVTFIDSTGIHALLDARRRVGTNGCRLAVICPAGTARRTLTLCGADSALPLFATRDEAHRNG
jgi:anti-sigma B factor antagonist